MLNIVYGHIASTLFMLRCVLDIFWASHGLPSLADRCASGPVDVSNRHACTFAASVAQSAVVAVLRIISPIEP
jgi:hypothetical protein